MLKKINHIYHSILNSPINYIWFGLSSRLRRALLKRNLNNNENILSDNYFVNSLDSRFKNIDAFVVHIKKRNIPKFFLPSRSSDTRKLILEINPIIEDLTIESADRILNHKFDLLGSGLINLSEEIDWHSDFKSGYQWPSDLYYSDIKKAEFPGGFDIKIPWELSRFQHAVWLGQAYWFTGDEKYASEFASQVFSWINDNPYPFGVNWSCTMDVSIRAVNWLWGYYYFKDSGYLSDELLVSILKSLLLHGQHIMSNLEIYFTSKGPLTSNHYLSNLVGLIYLGILLPEFRDAKKWLDFGLQGLEQEIMKQTLGDGADYEASISYHRLVTEMFISAFLISRINGIELSTPYVTRLEKMIEFILQITKPDGTAPSIGDNDNGRIHRLKVWKNSEKEWVDFRYLLAIGAVIYEREDFATHAGDNWEEAFWLFGEKTIDYIHLNNDLKNLSNKQVSIAFVEAGIYVLRHGGNYIVIDAGRNGQMGFGGHAHNDIFSFEFFAGNRTWIVDPGTYVYTSDYGSRQLFRSTAYHNTVLLDGHEQNVINAEYPFRMESDADVDVIEWDDNVNYIFFCGEHFGFSGLHEDLIHRRYFYFDKDTEVLIINDSLHGAYKNRIDAFSHLHLSPNLVPSPNNKNTGDFHIPGNNQEVLNIRILEPADFQSSIKDTWVSPSYGLKVEAKTIAWSWRKQSISSITLYTIDDNRLLDSRINNTLKRMNQLI